MSSDPTIVLVHGLTIVRDVNNQFLGVPEALRERGYRVHKTLVKGGGTLHHLAERVWQQIEPVPGPVVLLCHSMGGLQARTFLLDDARAERIQAIVTVGSPHDGFILPSLMSPFDAAYRAMTAASRARWAAEYGEAERAGATKHGVRCLSVIASLKRAPSYPRLTVPHVLLNRVAGPNDGLVPAAAQRWGEAAFEVDLDHLECACVQPPSPRASECVDLWVRMAEAACGAVARSSTGSGEK